MLKHLEKLKVLAVFVGVVTAMVIYKHDFDRRQASRKSKERDPSDDHWD